MYRSATGLTLSATDLANFLGCRHRTALDMAVAAGARERPFVEDPLLDLLWKRGLEHERQYVESLRDSGKQIVDLTDSATNDERIKKTMHAMRDGADVIVQGGLRDDPWAGKPDILLRVETPSALGAWSYEVADTKLPRETRAGTILQLGLYSEMLGLAQGVRPERFYVITPDALTPVHTYRVDDYAAYFRRVRAQLLAFVEQDYQQLAKDHYPDPVEHCEICHWSVDCRDTRRADDHLSLVAGISRTQRRELEARSVGTLTSLASLTLPMNPPPKRGSAETYERVREQARLQHASRGKTPPLHELLAVEAEKGLCRLPEPTPGDLFLDLEGDPFAREGGREYLFGVVKADGSYHSAWAFTDAEEKRGFEWVMDMVAQSAREHPGMHVYHYAPYEPAAFKRLMGRHTTRESEMDSMLREGRFVDLYAVVKQGLRAGIESYSIKQLEPLYAYTRDVALFDARLNLRVMEYGLETGAPEEVPASARDTVEGYNRDDCVSTLRLRDWLERARDGLIANGTEVPRKTLDAGTASDAVNDRALLVEALRTKLVEGVPELVSDRTKEQQGRWLLAYMLDYHRREDKAVWHEYYRLVELPEDDLIDERGAVAGMRFVERLGFVLGKNGKPTKTVVDRYSYPLQEMEIDRGEVRLQDKKKFGDVVTVDRIKRTIDIEKGPSRANIHPSAVFAFSYVPSDAMVDAITRIGESVAAGDTGFGAARSLLASDAPRLKSRSLAALGTTDSAVELATRIVGELDETVLAIQGPPGAGKTFCGARMICELVRQGKRVGITATGHKVIRNLLDAVATEADRSNTDVRLAHKCGDEEVPGTPPRVKPIGENAEALDALTSGDANVLGGTAWLWSRPEFASSVDVLFVDEAGQMALANVLAVSQAANSLVLLGDPQQLEQPRKGSHPDGVDASALEHILGEHQTIPADRGIFLRETWRLAPSICAFTSELFYENRLTSRAGLENQRLKSRSLASLGTTDNDLSSRQEREARPRDLLFTIPDSGLALVDVVHDGNRNSSQEEIEVVADLVNRLTTNGSTWFDQENVERQLTGSDVLIVSPFNAQVTRLTERLAGTGVRVGTVDKFQGQEAPVVIYSMASSSPEDAPRGMEFLYSLNRLNVATSRARCLAILVASPRLYEAECRSPAQMKLANALCRYREMAVAAL